MLRIVQRFGKQCSYHFQGEFLGVGRFWKLYKGQAVGGELVKTALFSGADDCTANKA